MMPETFLFHLGISILISCTCTFIAEFSIMGNVKLYLRDKRIWFTKDQFDNYYIKSVKPLDCGKCLSFWITLLFFLFVKHEYVFCTLFAGTSSIFSITLVKLLR